MKGGAVSSLQLWIYRLQDEMYKREGNHLSISVAMVRKKGIISNTERERQNLLISMIREGDAGWLGMSIVFYKLG